MMAAVGSQNGSGIWGVQLFKPLEAPVDIYVVNEEIDQSVNRYANSYKKQPPLRCCQANHVGYGAWNGEHQKEQVVFFEKAMFFVMGFVMVFMPHPQPTMHQVFMSAPGNEFHDQDGRQRNQGVKDNKHRIVSLKTNRIR